MALAKRSRLGQVVGLPPTQRAAAVEALREAFPIRFQPAYCPYMPEPKQAVLLALNDLEVFFGGAAGPGKSTALLMAALQYVDVPGYAALLLRRTYSDLALPGALMDMAFDWFERTPAKWNAALKTWSFPGGGTITFGHLEHEHQKRRYAGAEFQFVGFDELTQFTETQYTFLFSRLRKPRFSHGLSSDGLGIADVPLRMRSASNPGGPGHQWVKKRLVDPKTREDGSRFIPALMSENPHLDQESYEQSLAQLGRTERRRLMRGDWGARDDGVMFHRDWFPIIKPFEMPYPEWRFVRYWDLASTAVSQSAPDPDWTVGLRYAFRPSTGEFVITDIRRMRTTPHQVKQAIQAAAERDGRETMIRIEQEPGSAGVNVVDMYKRELPDRMVAGHRPTGPKDVRAQVAASKAENGLISLFDGRWVEPFLDELEDFMSESMVHDDQVDALSGAHDCVVKVAPLRSSSAATVRVPSAIGGRR